MTLTFAPRYCRLVQRGAWGAKVRDGRSSCRVLQFCRPHYSARAPQRSPWRGRGIATLDVMHPGPYAEFFGLVWTSSGLLQKNNPHSGVYGPGCMIWRNGWNPRRGVGAWTVSLTRTASSLNTKHSTGFACTARAQGVRLAQKMQVGPCISVRMQR